MLRRPALHFVAIGAALFGLKLLLAPAPPRPATPAPIVITSAQIEQLLAEYSVRTGRQPTRDDEAALVNQTIEEELLYRAALELGLSRNDRSVRYRLVEKMHFLADERQDPQALYREALDLGLDRNDAVVHRLLVAKMRLLAATPPDDTFGDAELHAYFEQHPEHYLQPPRVALTHIFFSKEKWAATAGEKAAAVLKRLRSDGTAPEHTIQYGDDFPLGHHFSSSSAAHLAKLFGPEFAAAIMDLPTGRWTGPIASPYGLHLVWVEVRVPAQLPPFSMVRQQVLEALRSERHGQRLCQVLDQLRRQYVVRVEWPADAARG